MGPSLTSFIASNYALLQPTLVTIPGGTFTMGAGTDYGAHQASISTFQMGRTQVTNDEYARYLASLGDRRYALVGTNLATRTLGVIALGPSEDQIRSAVDLEVVRAADSLMTSGLYVLGYVMKKILDSFDVINIKDKKSRAEFDSPRQPVINVDWFEAAVYAFLHGAMLPTESQWEYAARVVQGREGLRKYATPSGELTHEEAHFGAESTIDVDDPRYPTLENGLRHMTGNVWEWVDPVGSLNGDLRSLRGGAWFFTYVNELRANHRQHEDPFNYTETIGFRVAAPAESDR